MSTPRPIGLALLAVLAVAMVPAAAAAAPAGADDTDALIAPAVKSWAALQRPDGSFRDYILTRRALPGTDRYGPAMLGLVFLRRATATRDAGLARAGLRAVRYTLLHRTPGARQVFEDFALAAAWPVARDMALATSTFAGIRPLWQARLRAMRPAIFGRGRPYYNYHLVQAVTVLEVLRSGLRSTRPGSVLATRSASRAAAVKVVEVTVPAVAARTATPSAAGRLALVSDPPANPLAYHGFSLALLARAVALLGPEATPRARAVLADGARACWALMSPDGDATYSGRSQEQAWTLAMTAAAVAAAGTQPGTSALDAARDRAVAERALARLRAVYAGGPYGLWPAPALRGGITAGIHGLDPYAAAGSYTALTLLGLQWTAPALAALPPGTAPLGGDTPGAFHIGRGTSAFVTVRTPTAWFVVKQSPVARARTGVDYTGDLRYDGGLIALDVLTPAGAWAPVVPLRPRTAAGLDSAGPAPRRHGRRTRPTGGRLRVPDGRTVTLDTGFRGGDGRRIGTRATLRFEPVDCGVRIVIPARAGELWEYSAFFTGRPRIRGRSISDGHQRVTYTGRATTTTERGYASGDSAHLTRVRIVLHVRHTGRAAITECRA